MMYLLVVWNFILCLFTKIIDKFWYYSTCNKNAYVYDVIYFNDLLKEIWRRKLKDNRTLNTNNVQFIETYYYIPEQQHIYLLQLYPNCIFLYLEKHALKFNNTANLTWNRQNTDLYSTIIVMKRYIFYEILAKFYDIFLSCSDYYTFLEINKHTVRCMEKTFIDLSKNIVPETSQRIVKNYKNDLIVDVYNCEDIDSL